MVPGGGVDPPMELSAVLRRRNPPGRKVASRTSGRWLKYCQPSNAVTDEEPSERGETRCRGRDRGSKCEVIPT
jgi:hypothetical protein